MKMDTSLMFKEINNKSSVNHFLTQYLSNRLWQFSFKNQ